MTKNSHKIYGFTLIFLGFITDTSAIEIDLTISGSGKVIEKETGQECSENCIINNSSLQNLLIAEADTGAEFLGWSGQKCDFGDEVRIGDTSKVIGSATGGSKTLGAGDFNGDGVIDLVQISLFNGKVQKLINDGNGNFTKTSIAEDLAYPSALSVFDWESDGDLDLIVAEYEKKRLNLYKNDGNGVFELDKHIKIGDLSPYAVAVADIDNDGLPDLAISSFDALTSGDLFVLVNSIKNQETAWYRNSGSDSFSKYAEVSNFASITLDAEKQNGSEDTALVSAEIVQDEIAHYTLHRKIISRDVLANLGNAYGAAIEDIDLDGDLDVLAAQYRPSALKIIYAEQEGQFKQAQHIGGFGEGVTATAIADVNNDGYKDVITGEFNTGKFHAFYTQGYKSCGVSTEAKINITASFGDVNQASSSNSNSGSSSANAQSSGGGGALSISALIVLLLVRLKRIKF